MLALEQTAVDASTRLNQAGTSLASNSAFSLLPNFRRRLPSQNDIGVDLRPSEHEPYLCMGAGACHQTFRPRGLPFS